MEPVLSFTPWYAPLDGSRRSTTGYRGDFMNDDGQRELDQAFDELEQEGSEPVARAVRWLRSPASRRVRIPLGVLFIAGGVLWFLPLVGLEMIPLGLLIIAQDVPFLRKPVGRGVSWLVRQWQA